MIPRFRLLSIKLLFRGIIGLDGFRDDRTGRVAFLKILALRRDRSRHVATLESEYSNYSDYSDYSDKNLFHKFILSL